jgi:hypothetical protein
MTATPVPNREAQLEAVLQAHMLTIEEWTDLARAVAACQERKTADCLTEHDLEDIAERYALEWDEATDGPLPDHDES